MIIDIFCWNEFTIRHRYIFSNLGVTSGSGVRSGEYYVTPGTTTSYVGAPTTTTYVGGPTTTYLGGQTTYVGAPTTTTTYVSGPATTSYPTTSYVTGGSAYGSTYGQTATYVSGAVTSGLVGGIATSGAHRVAAEEIPVESRIEYIPFEKKYIEYDRVERIERVPFEREIVEYE